MKPNMRLWSTIICVVGGVILSWGVYRTAATSVKMTVPPGDAPPLQQNANRGTREDHLVIELCDGETTMEVRDVAAGAVLPPARAREVAARLMASYQAKQRSQWTERDRMIWEREQKRVIGEGYRLFHDWKALGGTNGISCDMCHPDAADTHPETYPKFQTQLKQVATLRDMINWCIEHPMKGKPLDCNDPRMIALESYITSQRKGVPLAPGKH